MPTSSKPSPTFPIIYHDAHDLYLEWPTHVQRFAFTEGGLAKALKLIPSIETQNSKPDLPRAGNIPDRVASVNGKIAKISTATQRARKRKRLSAGAKATLNDILREMKSK